MATTMPPQAWYDAGKLSNPAPRAAFTTRNTDIYHVDPTERNKYSTDQEKSNYIIELINYNNI